MTCINIVITKHAKQRMAEYAITIEQIKSAIVRGAKFRQTGGYLAKYTYFHVAYKKIGDNRYKIKTVSVR